MPGDDWIEGRREFLRDLEHEAVVMRKRATEAERELHELGESLEGEMVGSRAEAGEAGDRDPRLLRHVAASSMRAAAEADNLTEELRGLLRLHSEDEG